MALTVNVNAQLALQKLGLDTKPLDAAGIALVPYSGGVKFVKEHEVFASWAVAPAKVAEIGQNGYDPNSLMHAAAKGNAEAAYTQALQMAGKPVAGASKSASKKPGKTVPVAAAVATYPVEDMKTGTQVPLIKADMLYQPVKSTSAGSRYYVVGLSDTIKVAARLKANTLSIRIEGKAFSALAPVLSASGFFGATFGGSFTDDYASMHVEIANAFDAQKVVGSVLGILYEHIKHGVPSLKPLENI